jgi:hypothetical protein
MVSVASWLSVCACICQRVNAKNGLMDTNKPVDERAAKLAKGYIREGKSFIQAGIEAGYSPKFMRLGPAAVTRKSGVIKAALAAESQSERFDAELARELNRARLLDAVKTGIPCKVVKEIELLGRDKAVDQWVRTGDMQVGIFNTLMTPEAGNILEALPPEE